MQFTVGPKSEKPAAADAIAPVAGIFDSGLGGLSVVREMVNRSSQMPFVYVADQAHAPYGDRSFRELRGFSEGITEYFKKQSVQIIAIACNTASAAALYSMREQYPFIHFVGMEPAIKPAAERTRTGKIAVIATRGTFEGEPYAGVLARFARDVEVYTRVCPDFVNLVEDGDFDSARALEIVAAVIHPLLDKGVDQLALGCTHYSFLAPLIAAVADGALDIIDPAAAVARQLERVASRLAPKAGWDQGNAAPFQYFVTTGDVRRFEASVNKLLNLKITAASGRWSENE